MHTELFSLSKIFTENLFRIPDYQRGYSWTERQLKDFWSDLALLEPGRDHYTGVLTLEQARPEDFERWTDDLWIIQSKRFTPFYVVDGQQRLTTSLILLQTLLEATQSNDCLNYSTIDEIRKKFLFESRDKGISRSYIFGYEKDNPSYDFLKTKIFMEASDNHEIGEETIYTHNLLTAKEFFAKQLKEAKLTDLEQVFTKLTQHFLFNIYTISADIDVFVAFETMNNRGKPLSHLELLKNRLIFLSTRLGGDSSERSKVRSVVNESWKTVYHYLGRNRQQPLDDDQFLFVHFALYAGPMLYQEEAQKGIRGILGRLRRQEFYKTYLLDELFTSRNLQRAPSFGLLAEDNNHATLGSALRKGRERAATASQTSESLSVETIYSYSHDLKKCVRIYYQIFNPQDSDFSPEQRVTLTQLNRIEAIDASILLLAIILSNPKEREFTDLLRNLERHAFLRILKSPRLDPNDIDLTDLAIRIQKGTASVGEVAGKLNSHAEHYATREGLRFLTDTLRRGYYGWRGIRYFLFEYEQELKRKSRSRRDKLEWDIFTSEDYQHDYITIEHIYPQKPSDAWRPLFSQYSLKQRAALQNSLGNLVALSRPKNSSLSNRSFRDKREGSSETSGYRAGSYSEIEVAETNEWTAEQILERGIKMLSFMEKRWRLELGNKENKAHLLGLDFMSAKADNNKE